MTMDTTQFAGVEKVISAQNTFSDDIAWQPGKVGVVMADFNGGAGTVTLQGRFIKRSGEFTNWIDIKTWTASFVERFEQPAGLYRLGIKTSEYTSGDIYVSGRTEIME